MAIPKQVIGELRDIGQETVKQAASIPKDMAGAALESMGVSANPQQQSGGILKQIFGGGEGTAEGGAQGNANPFQKMQQAKSQQAKASIARQALAFLTQPRRKSEPSYYEKMQMEEEQKKEMEKQQQAMAAKNDIPAPKAKPKRGSLFAAKKQSGSETKQNVKSG